MKIGIVSDIHCNTEGLRQALCLLSGVDEVLCLGDSIYEYRFSNETIELLRRHNVTTILGNHEDVFFGRHGERARSAAWIDRELAGWLVAQPAERILMRAGRRIRMVHSTPWEPRGEYVLPTSPSFRLMGELGADVLLYGHTHHAVASRLGDCLVINPGSAGEARGHGPESLLSCAMLDLESGEAEILRYRDPVVCTDRAPG